VNIGLDATLGHEQSDHNGKHGDREFVTTDVVRQFPARPKAALLAPLRSIPPGGKRTVTFVLSWHFPNAPHDHEYSARFKNAGGVLRYVMDNLSRLTRDTRLWRDTYYDSDLDEIKAYTQAIKTPAGFQEYLEKRILNRRN
jgi:hypothetical protein